MKKLIVVLVVLIALSSCTSVKMYNEHITALHSVVDLREDVDKAYNQLQKQHPKLYQYTAKDVLDFKFDSLKTSITKPLTTREFYKKVAPVVANVRQGHVVVGYTIKRFTKKERKALKKQKLDFYDLEFEYLEDKLWVKNNYGKDSTLVGNEVVRIDNEPVSKLISVYKTRFASDGFNTTLHNRVVGKGFLAYYTRDKGFLDSLKVTFKNKDSVFVKSFKRISKDDKKDETKTDSIKPKKLKKKKLSKVEKQKNRLANKKRKKYNKKHGYISRGKQYTRNFNFIGQDSTIGLMKIRGFTNGNYKKFYEESFIKLDSAKTKYFILDLRDNGGGRIAEIDKLYSYLTDKNYQFLTESEVTNRIPFLKAFMSNTTSNSLKVVGGILSPFVALHNSFKIKKKDGKLYYKFNKHIKIKEPNPLHYEANMYVLINGNSFSASSLISTHLKANKRAIFVGEETGGAYNGTVAGIYKVYQLPTSKLKIRMGLMQIEAPQKQTPDGYGIKPDIKVLPTVADRNLKKDTELEWILADIKKKED